MKNFLLSTALLLSAVLVSGQVVTTTPAFITNDYIGVITVTYDPSQGSGDMGSATNCYAHTGIITSASSSDTDWKFVTDTWRGGSSKNKMTKVGTKWVLTINNMFNFYNCPTTTKILKLAFVFNDGPNGTKEGKTSDSKDIFITVYEAGLNVAFTTPTNSTLITSGTSIAFSATASTSCNLELKINGISKKTATGTSLSHSENFTTNGNYECIISANDGIETVYDTVKVCVAGTPVNATRPTDIKNGITYYENDPTKATLVTFAKDKNNVIAENIFVIGDFNNWDYDATYQMKKDGTTGYFWLDITGLESGKEYCFQYVVRKPDGSMVKISDPYSTKVLHPYDSYEPKHQDSTLINYPQGKADSYVTVLQTAKETFNWSNATLNFVKPNINNLVVYEMWLYDFSPARNLKSAIDRLDYLENLGVNAIELMPISEFDGNMSWGYNPNHFFASDKAYGSEKDYKTFIDECHKRGIAVLVDMVFNHGTGDHPWAKLYWDSANNKTASNNPWFNVDAPHPYSVFHDFNHEYNLTKEYFNEVLQYWINEYKIDGYRMDLTKGFTNRVCTESTASNYDQSRIDIIKGYHQAAKVADPNVIFIIEHFCTSSEEQVLVNDGIIPWNNLNNAYSQTAMGWLKDGDALSNSNKVGWISFAESHDEERNFYKAQQWGNGTVKTDETERLNRIALNVAFSVMQKGPKMIWQFGELGYDYSIDYNERTGTKPMPESLNWYQNANRMGGYKKVAQVNQLRHVYSNLFNNGTCTTTVGTGKSARYIQWTYNTDQMVIVGNFNVTTGTTYTGSTTVAPFATTGTWYEYFSGETLQISNTSQTITLQPGELRIYTNTYNTLPQIPDSYVFPDAINTIETNTSNNFVYPTVSDHTIYISAEELPQMIQIYGLRGDLVKQTRHVTEINISDLKRGIYLMVINFSKTQEAFKIIRK